MFHSDKCSFSEDPCPQNPRASWKPGGFIANGNARLHPAIMVELLTLQLVSTQEPNVYQ